MSYILGILIVGGMISFVAAATYLTLLYNHEEEEIDALEEDIDEFACEDCRYEELFESDLGGEHG